MGKQIASIHIIDSSLTFVDSQLMQLKEKYGNHFFNNKLNNIDSNILSDDEVVQLVSFIKLFHNKTSRKKRFYALFHEGNVSVFSDYLNYANVFDIAGSVFGESKKVIACSGFDDDFYFLKSFCEGNETASLGVGDMIEELFAFYPKNDLVAFSDVVSCDSIIIDQIDKLLKANDISVDVLSDMLSLATGLPLNWSLEDLLENKSNIHTTSVLV